jgi:hypothetical protein
MPTLMPAHFVIALALMGDGEPQQKRQPQHQEHVYSQRANRRTQKLYSKHKTKRSTNRIDQPRGKQR